MRGVREYGTRFAILVCDAGADHLPVLRIHARHSSRV
jgi:hypothetical protein